MAAIEITLGTVTIPDNTVESGLLTQQDMKDWLDEQFDTANAGGAYINRMTRALRMIGINGVTTRVAHHKVSKARALVGNKQAGLVTEAE